MFPVAGLTFLVTLPFDRRRVLLHRVTSVWAALYTWWNPWWRVEVVGRDLIDDDGVYVLVANHQSMVDIFVLFRLFKHFKWVSKASNFRIPLIGWNMYLNGYIPVQRGYRQSVVTMLDRCAQVLREGSSIMMFPEGTRSETGEMRPFKTGAFELALRCQCPIVPILVDGTHRALPKAGLAIEPAQIRVRVLEPISCEAFDTDDPAVLADRVQRLMALALRGG